jgi:group II intron reverse transcriptase/maturase
VLFVTGDQSQLRDAKEEPRKKVKPFSIEKTAVMEAYRRVRANRGTYGVDTVSLEEFERDLGGNLYKIWNRMSSGSYLPPAVRRVDIPKKGGKTRPLGIPTVADRVAQMVAKMYLEPLCEPQFSGSSYGYRPGRNAHMAVQQASENCKKYSWAIDLDIKSFFDTIDHGLLMKAVRRHTQERWVLLYVERWLDAPVQLQDGTLEARTAGTPQGSVISPLLANLFLHYVFDKWMERHVPYCPFERYADDIIVHCQTLTLANHVKTEIAKRFALCGLQLHPDKTCVVYCKHGKSKNQGGGHKPVSFDFLGFTFKPRQRREHNARLCTWWTYAPAISGKAKKRLMDEVRSWHIGRRTGSTLGRLAHDLNPVIRGWVTYYGHFRKWELLGVLAGIDNHLVTWATRKYRRFRRSRKLAYTWLVHLKHQSPELFAHWTLAHAQND